MVLTVTQAYAKTMNPQKGKAGFSWHNTTPGLLASAIRAYGWRFIPDQLAPPLLANIAVGVVLYTSYLQVLGAVHEPSAQSAKRVFPPPPPSATFTAGFVAGGIQSLVAAPLDALQVRFNTRGSHGEHKSMWRYAKEKLCEIGPRGIFAGWGLSFVKDSLGSGIFFSVFELIKAQAYYKFVRTYYGSLEPWMVENYTRPRGMIPMDQPKVPTIKPHYALEPIFFMLAGIAASVAQHVILFPLTKIQNLHYGRLEELDQQARKVQKPPHQRRALHAYYHAYQQTWRRCKMKAGNDVLTRLLFRGFWWNTVRQIPSTSAGLVIFELVRRNYGLGEEAKISEDGYDILLS